MNIRQFLLQISPVSSRGVDSDLDTPTDENALEYAVEGLLRSVSGVGSLDDFDFFCVIDETSTHMEIIGLAYFLPNRTLPLKVSFSLENENMTYRVLLGSDATNWHALSDSKRWKAVYLHAKEGQSPGWNWDAPIEGSIPTT